MMNFIDWVCGKDTQKTLGDVSSVTHGDMTDVMRRVDEQIGRAVTRLSDR